MHALVRVGMVAGGVTSHLTQVCMQVAQWLIGPRLMHSEQMYMLYARG